MKGVAKQGRKDPSFYNLAEVLSVIGWITKLIKIENVLLKDIGVVSPYKKQCDLIRQHLTNSGLEGITVGTAETYQGQERKIMIISTVRTGHDLGFITNEKVIFKLL